VTFTFEWSSQLSGSGSQEAELTNVVRPFNGIYILKWEEFLATLNDKYTIPHVTRVTSKATCVTPKSTHVTSKGAHVMCDGKGTA